MKNKSASQSVLICLFIVLAFTVYSSPARADTTTTTWTGYHGSWSSGANWNNGVPTSSTDAFVNNGGRAQITSSGAIAQSLTLGLNGGDSGIVTVNGTNGGSLTVPLEGAIFVGYRDRGTLSITNGGTVTSGYGYIARFEGDEFLTSNGSVTVDGANSIWTITGTELARLFVGGNDDDPGGTALLNVTNGGTVMVNNPNPVGDPSTQTSVVVGRSGTLTGNGTIITIGPSFFSMLTRVDGTLAPSGPLKIVGNLVLSSTATTLCNVTPEAADVVDVSITAYLSGRLSVTMTGTFTPGARYELLKAAESRFGTFSNGVSITYPTDQGFTPQITYDGNYVYLDLQSNE